MAIPTQFSVTSTRTSPIANPSAPQDLPQSLDAENVSIVDGAEVLSSLSSTIVDAPSALTSESGVTIPLPAELTAKVQAAIDNAVTIPAEAQAGINAPVEATALPSATIDNVSALPAESVAAIAAPTALTAKAGTLTTPPFPLNHARILWRNKLEVFQTVNQSEGVGLNAIKPNTWEKWRFDSTASNSALLITLNNPLSIDTICIGAHNLGDVSATVSITYSVDGVAFIDWEPDFAVTSNAPIMRHIATARSVKALQITITTGATGLSEIGFISAGEALQMQRPFFNGHTPITDGDATQYYSNRTESGEIIGQQIRRQGFETSADWQNIDDTWYRTYFAPFKQSAKLRPFFFAWNLLEYPDDVGFCRISQDISAPMQNGTVTKRSISMNLLGAG